MRLLFITATRLGDAILSTGLLDHLIRAHPGAAVTVACGALPAPLFRAVPGLEAIIPLVKRPRGGHWIDLWTRIVRRRWDLVVDLRGSAISWLVATRGRIVWNAAKGADHRVVQIARLIGLETPPAPRLWLDDAALAAGRVLVPDGPPLLALGPTTNWRGKQWPPERFAELAHVLAYPRVGLFGAPAERQAAQPLFDALPGALDGFGAPDLPAVAAALGRAALYIGNDSGLMHLAAAIGTPTLGLFGPSDEHHFAPWGNRAGHVRTDEDRDALFARLERDPAALDRLMDGLPVARAEAAARALVQRCA